MKTTKAEEKKLKQLDGILETFAQGWYAESELSGKDAVAGARVADAERKAARSMLLREMRRRTKSENRVKELEDLLNRGFAWTGSTNP